MLRDILYSIDANTMILICFFFIIFAFLNWILFKIFKNKTTSGIISFCIALMSVYGFNRMNWDFPGFFSGIGVSENLFYGMVPVLILILLAFLFWKLKFSGFLMMVGALIIAASLLGFVYEKMIFLIIGIVLFLIGFFLWFRKWRRSKKKLSLGNPSKNLNKQSRRERRRQEREARRKAKELEKQKKLQKQQPVQQVQPQTKKQQKQQAQQQVQQQETEKQQRKARKRSYAELLKKYESYSNAIKQLQRKNNGKIPALGTPEGDLRHRYVQAMQAIENLANQQGFKMPRDSVKLEKQGRKAQRNSPRDVQKRKRDLEKLYHQKEKEYNFYMGKAMKGSTSAKTKADQIAQEVQGIVNEMNKLSGQ